MFKRLKETWLKKFYINLESEFSGEIEIKKQELKREFDNQIEFLRLEYDAQKSIVKLELEKLKNEFLLSKENLNKKIREELDLLEREDFNVRSVRERFSKEKTELNLKMSEINIESENRISELKTTWEIRKKSILDKISEDQSFVEEKKKDVESTKLNLDKLEKSLANKIKLVMQEQEDLENGWEQKRKSLLSKIQIDLDKIHQKEEDTKFLQERIESKQRDLEKVREDLDLKIKVIEAKASPNAIWIEAFNSGFNKAWDSMQPIMLEGVQKSKKAIENIAIMETMQRNVNGHNKKNN